MSDISLGTLYDVNKNLVLKNEIKLTDGVLNSKKEIITNFMRKMNNTYYMLLCNERKDYTIFTSEILSFFVRIKISSSILFIGTMIVLISLPSSKIETVCVKVKGLIFTNNILFI